MRRRDFFGSGSGFDAASIMSGAMAWTLFKIVLVVLFWLVITAKHKKDESVEGEMASVGTLTIETVWDGERDTDVDTHLADPRSKWVWFNEPDTHYCNLVRDDRGFIYEDHEMEGARVNLENIFCHGIIPGEHTVNLNLYENNANILPVSVFVRGSIHRKGAKAPSEIFKRSVKLTFPGQEMTVFRFSLDKNGTITFQDAHPPNRSHFEELGEYYTGKRGIPQ